MQMQELQLKAQEQQRKAAKDQTDAQIKMQQLQLEAERIKSQSRVAAGQLLAQGTMNKEKLKSQQIQAAGRIALDAMSKQTQQKHEITTRALDHVSKREMATQQAGHQMEHAEKQSSLQPKTPPKKEAK